MPIIKGFADFEPLTPEPKSGVIKGFEDFEPVYRSTVAPPESGDFMTGVKQSGLELAGTAYGLAGLAGAGVGSEGLKQWGLENAQRKFEESGAMGKEVYSLEGINSVGDAVDYLQRGVGYVGAQAIPAILTGGVGSAMAKKFVEQGVKELAKKTVAGSAAEQAAILAAKQQVGRASTRGAIGSMGITGYGQAAGALYPEMVSEGYDEPGRAALFAAPIAALDVIPAARAARQILMPGAKKGILKEIRNQAAGEALTEVGQTGIERQAAYKDLMSPEARSEYLNAAALGALGGGLLGGASAALNNRAVESNVLGTANPTVDEQRPLLGIGYNPAAGTPTVFPDGSQALGSEEVAPISEVAPAAAVASSVDQEILDAAASLGLNLNNTRGKPLPRKVELFTKAFDLYKAGAIDDSVYTQTVERLKKRGLHNDVEALLTEADTAFVEKQRKAAQPKFQRAPRPEGQDVGTAVSTAGGPAPSVGTGGADVSGGVASTGPAVNVGPAGDVGTRVAGISPASNETSLLGNVSDKPSTTLTLPKPKELSEEDQLAIEEMTGDKGLAQAVEEQNQRDEMGAGAEVSLTPDEEAQTIERILEARFANSKNKERDIKIARDYITAQKSPTQGFSTKVQLAIGAPYGIKDEAVRDIGNIKALVDAAVSLGMTEAEARMLLTGEMAPEVIGAKDSEGKPVEGLQGAIAEAGVESEEGATGGFGYDDSRTWAQGVKGAGDMINAADEKFANRVYVLSEKVESLEATMRALPNTSETLTADLIEAKRELDEALVKYNDFLAGKTKPKKAKAGSKKAALAESTEEAPTEDVSGRDVWNQLREDIVGLGEYKDLTKSEKGYLDELAARTNGDFTLASEPSLETVIDNNMDYDRVADEAASDAFTEDFEADDGTPRYSKVKGTQKTKNTIYNIWNTLARLFDVSPADSAYKDFIRVSQTAEDAYKASNKKVPLAQLQNAQAFIDPTDDRIVHLIADNITKGSELAVLLHEVGIHVGLKKKLGANFKILEGQVKAWANSPKDSLERKIYEAAMARVAAARLDGAITADIAAEELVAYAAEEAALAGVKVRTAPRTKLEAWVKQLHDIATQAFKNFFKLTDVPALSVQDLVNFSFAAAQEHMQAYRSEVGATETATESQVAKYYAGAKGTYEGTKVVINEGNPNPGEESFFWNPTDKFGSFTGIGTRGFYSPAEPRSPEYAAMVVTSAESRAFGDAQKNNQDKILLTFQATRDPQTNIWSLIVSGPDIDSALYVDLYVEGLATTTKDNEGNEWSRLEGISGRDNLRLLGEFRRRLTRMKAGEIPNIDFVRVTGSGASKEDGRPGVYAADTLATRFSKAPEVEGSVTPEFLKQASSNKEKILNSVAAETVSNTAKKLLNTVVFSSDLFRIATKAGLKSAQKMATIYRQRSNFEGSIEKEVERIATLYTRIPQNERGMGEGSANALLRDMTREGKWGFKPKWRTGDTANVKIDGDMARRWKSMSEASKNWMEQTLQHGDFMLKLKQQTLTEATNSEYDILIKDAQAKGNTAKVAKLQADKRNQLKQFERLFAVDTMRPYAPLSRYGNYVVVANSAAFENATAEQRAKMEDDPKHHTVTFAESMASALTLKRQLEEQGGFKKIEAFEKEKAQEGMYGGLMKAFNQLRGSLDSELANITDPEDRNTLLKARAVVADLYLSSLAENSARKAELRRKGVAGEIDMLRSFATRGRADAQFLATVKYTPQMTEVINKLRQETKEGGRSIEKSQAFNEIMARHNQTLAYDDSAWNEVVGRITRATSVWLLATSPMYYLQNMTQPGMLSVPFMTKQHNYFKVWRSLLKSYSELGNLIKNSKLDEQFDFNNVPADVRTMISTLVDRQQIDIGMETELGRFQLSGESAAAQGINKADRILRSLSQKMEIINRVSTAMAAYRLELARTGNINQATEYASEVIEQTHGDYTRINAPRAFNTNVGKVTLQFRKFQLIQGTLLLKLLKNSLAGATKEERTAAFTALKFTLGHTLAMTGLVGFPGWAALSFIINGLVGIFGDDEEPYNLENDIYQSLVEQFGEDAATMIMRGTPTLGGIDVSGKIGMGNVLSILPFTDFELSKAGVSDVGFAIAFGASGSLAQRFADGLKLIGSGEYYRGLEKLAPKGFADAGKALRENDEGVTRLNGDVLVPADEIEGIKSFAKGLGIPVVSETKRRLFTDVKFDTEKAFKEKAIKLKNQFTKARKEGEDTSAIREKWAKLQEERVSEGFKREPLSSLLQAPRAQAERERQTVGGIQFNKQTRRFTEELVGEQ